MKSKDVDLVTVTQDAKTWGKIASQTDDDVWMNLREHLKWRVDSQAIVALGFIIKSQVETNK